MINVGSLRNVGTTVPRSKRSQCCCQAAKVVFSVPRKVSYGHSVGLVGSLAPIGKWDTSKALQLGWGKNNLWSGEVEVPNGESVEYKFFVKSGDGKVQYWQPGKNLVLKVPSDETVLLVTDDWHGKDRILRTWSESNGHENGNGNVTPSPLQTQAPVASAAAPSGQFETSAESVPASSSVLEAPAAAESVPAAAESVPAAPLPVDSMAQPDAGRAAAEASDSELTDEEEEDGEKQRAEEDEEDLRNLSTRERLERMTVVQLRAVLKSNGLKIPRLKAEMIEALLDSDAERE